MLRAKVEEVIEVLRPIIQQDQGDVVLHDVDEAAGIVKVELVGACASCPASTQTLKAGLERILMDRVPGITEVVNVGESDGTGPAGALAGGWGDAGGLSETPVSL